MTTNRICLDCQRITPVAQSRAGRCPTCYPTYRNSKNKQRRPPKPNSKRAQRTALYQTPAWRKARKIAIERDGMACTHCGTDVLLSVHHIRSVLEAPDLATDPDNLITLCRRCHAQLENRQRALIARRRAQGGGIA